MDAFKRNTVARTAFEVTPLGFGGGTLGDPDELTEDARADAGSAVTCGLAISVSAHEPS